MASFNQVTLLGNVTREIEVRYLQSGTAICDVSLAINEKYKKDGEWIEDVVFVEVTCWGRTAEVAGEYLSNGSPVLIAGRLKYEQWEKDGQKRSKLKVVADKLQLIGGKGRNEHSQEREEAPQEQGQVPPVQDEIPFAWVGLLIGLLTMGGAPWIA